MGVAEMLDEGQLLHCSSCRTWKTRDGFSVQQRGTDGSVLRYDSSCLTCRRRAASQRRGGPRSLAPTVRRREPPSPSLPAGPFRVWLRSRLIIEGVWDPVAEKPRTPRERQGRSLADLADDWGSSAKRFYDVMHGLEAVNLVLVDTVTCRAGEPYTLSELYPNLDEILGVAA